VSSSKDEKVVDEEVVSKMVEDRAEKEIPKGSQDEMR
jgi:hypothetical protein